MPQHLQEPIKGMDLFYGKQIALLAFGSLFTDQNFIQLLCQQFGPEEQDYSILYKRRRKNG